jgi:hypothetical protein
MNIFEYAIKCNNSLIIRWFEKNIPAFESTSNTYLGRNIGMIKHFMDERHHKNYDFRTGYIIDDDNKNIYNSVWFKKYFARFQQSSYCYDNNTQKTINFWNWNSVYC